MDKVHFEDLTKINVPFGLLDDNTQTRLLAWEHGFENFTTFYGWTPTELTAIPKRWASVAIRAKSAPIIKDTVPWHLLEPRWKWYARNKHGDCFVFEFKPELYQAWWQVAPLEDGVGVCVSGVLKDHEIGTVDWKDSLVQRADDIRMVLR